MATGTQPVIETTASATEVPSVSNWLRLVELVFVVLAATYLPYLGTIYYLTGGSIEHHGPDWYRTAYMLGYEFTGLAIVCYILFRRGQHLSSIGFSLRWRDLWTGALVWVGALAAGVIWSSCYYRIYHAFFGAYPAQRDLHSLFQVHIGVLWAVSLIVNGFYEEGIIRGFVTSDLTALTGNRWIAGAASVLLQIGYHGYQGLTNVMLILPLFLFFAVYYAKTGRLTPLIVAHSLQDFLALSHYRH